MGTTKRVGIAAALALVLLGAGCGDDDTKVRSAGDESSVSSLDEVPIGSDDESPVSSDDETPVGGDDQTLGADESASVSGVVTGADGRPIEGALLTPRSLDKPAPALPEIAVLTDATGSYSYPLPPGKWELTASADGYEPATESVEVTTGEPVEVSFVLSPSG